MLLAMPGMPDELVFEVVTVLGFRVRMSMRRWRLIADFKHPVMDGREEDVAEAVGNPDQIRRSVSDSDVYLFYRRDHRNRWICVVAKRLDGDGFVITTYPTDVIKEGERIWAG